MVELLEPAVVLHEEDGLWSADPGKDALDDIALGLVTREIGFIYSPEFDSLQYAEVSESADSDENFIPPEVDSSTSLSKLPPYIADLYSRPMLTALGERVLFRKMNYLKYRANILRSGLDPQHSSQAVVDKIQSLLEEADRTRNQIVESNLRLVVSIARKFSSNEKSFEELVSEGNLILLKAVEKFDYSRGYRFSTYLTHSVQRHYYRHLQRNQRRNKKQSSVDQNIIDESLADTSEDHLESYEEQASFLLLKMQECLDEREQFIIRERFGFGDDKTQRTYQSLARDLSICKERVRQILKSALGKLENLAAENKLDIVIA